MGLSSHAGHLADLRGHERDLRIQRILLALLYASKSTLPHEIPWYSINNLLRLRRGSANLLNREYRSGNKMTVHYSNDEIQSSAGETDVLGLALLDQLSLKGRVSVGNFATTP